MRIRSFIPGTSRHGLEEGPVHEGRSRAGAVARYLALLLLALPLCSNGAQDTIPVAQSEAPSAQAQQTFELKVHGNRLTFKGAQVPLHEVLKALSREAQLKIQLPAYLAKQEVSLAITDAPMAAGIKRLLEGNSYTLQFEERRADTMGLYEATTKVNYRAAPDIGAERLGSVEAGWRVIVTGRVGDWFRSTIRPQQQSEVFIHRDFLRPVDEDTREPEVSAESRKIVELRVLSTGAAVDDSGSQALIIESPSPSAGLAPQTAEPSGGVDPDVRDAVEELLSEASAAASPKEKLAAILAASSIGAADQRVHDLMVSSLHDSSPEVRRGALQSLEAVGTRMPLEPIASMALRDDLPELRIYAMNVITNNFPPDAVAGVLRRGVQDADSRVSTVAKRLLRDVER